MNRIHLIYLLAFVLNPFGLLAQDASYEIVKRPREFQGMLSDAIVSDFQENPAADFTKLNFDSGIEWKAWSDRASNEVKLKPDGGAKTVSYLDLKEAVMVTDFTNNGWLQIITRQSMLEGGGPIGWIPGIKLVLWGTPLVKNGIARKAMVMSNANTISGLSQVNLNTSVSSVYHHPNTTITNRMGKKAKLFNILYILKESSSAYLLSENGTGSSIYGWMPKSNLTDWNSRVCYAPNYGTQAMSDYPNPLPFSSEKNDLNSYNPKLPFTKGISGPNFEFKVGESEVPFYIPRWPDIGETRITGQVEREILMIAGASMDPISAEELHEARQKLKRLKAKISNVNLIFVLDATSSMRRYYSNIAQSITKICDVTKKMDEDETVNVKVTVGFYKDYADGDPIVIDNQTYSEVISKKIKDQPCGSIDPDRSEAVYQGIIKTLDFSGVGKEESNIVILVGDEGNHVNDDKYSRDDVLAKLEEYNAKLYVFQSTAKMQAESMKFQEDAVYWLDGIKSDQDYKLSFIDDGLYGLVKNNDISISGFSGEYGRIRTRSSGAGKPTSPKEMEKHIGREINDWIFSVIDEMAEWENIINNGAEGTKVHCDKLKEIFNINLCKKRSDVSFSAHTLIRGKGVEEPCLIPYVYMSRTEIENLKSQFKELANCSSDIGCNEALENLIRRMIMNIIGANQNTMSLYESEAVGEIWETIFQVEFNISELRDIPLKDLKGIPEKDFSNAFNDLRKVAEEFIYINNDEFKWKEIQDESFYWIPATYFPGY